ncbi:ribosome small subunit-dependent GTPase A [Prochlorococcus sp. MIT 1300]|uniref:ribosome small subunit-dependent GTPase A n=1 Tax=Prochlorococcus sp. MIT 1300 TaxID=3096218 RepID=UPI002A7640F7|nr:ribosome small subunit-dependent GTPase A [Prochlorococcus sp. MIT 1300]
MSTTVESEFNSLIGTVVASQANYFEVELDDLNKNILMDLNGFDHQKSLRILCTRRSRLDHIGTLVSTGDRVWIEAIDWKACTGVIVKVEPRISWIDRPPVANITSLFVVLSLKNPAFDLDQASRFLLTAEKTGLDLHLLLTKTDLMAKNNVEQMLKRIEDWGYEPIPISIKSAEGLDHLKSLFLKKGLAVLCGPSGVGKSSLLSYFLKKKSIRVGKLSGRLQRGRHTTRHVELYSFATGCYVADTPGFNRPSLECDPSDLPYLFPEIRSKLNENRCKFRNCLHLDEPGCSIPKTWERYSFYRNSILEILNSRR